MTSPMLKNPHGFSFGMTPITRMGEPLDAQMNFSILRLKAGEHYDFGSSLESVALLLKGDVSFSYDNEQTQVKRENFFEEAPKVLHLAPRQRAKIAARKETELAIVTTDNEATFENRLFDEHTMLENEHRGKGLLNDTAYRIVRTVFDKRNRPASNLVVGEVITYPGRWSSYPPHYHAQPEIYHYRFTEPQGYGHAELGDDVHKIRNYDTIKILEKSTHSQVSAPGYGMYYLWVIRHLPQDPYIVPTFVEEHAWTKESGANGRVWSPT